MTQVWQAAVWSYPVGVGEIGKPLPYDAAWVQENITDERIIMNMINSFLGRMHLASHLELLSEEQFSLIKEGVEYYDSITEDKKKAMPYFPNGFTRFGEKCIAAGLKTAEKIYLAVWNLGENATISVPIENAKKATLAYPKNKVNDFVFDGDTFKVCLKAKTARFFEIELN